MAGILLCLLSAGLLGVQMPLAKLSYEGGADPFSFALIRASLAIILFFSLAKLNGLSLRIPRSAIAILVVVALSNGMISFGYLGALDHISPSLAAMVFYLYPMLVLVVTAIRSAQLPHAGQACALVLAIAGLGLVFGPTFEALDGVGLGLGVIAAVGAASYFLLVPAASQQMNALVMLGWMNVIIAICFVPAFILEGRFALESTEISLIFWGGVIAYILGLGLTIPAIAKAGSVKSSLLYNFEPVTVVLVSVVFLGEDLASHQFLGIGAVICALILANVRGRERKVACV